MLSYAGICEHILVYASMFWHYANICWHMRAYAGICKHMRAYACTGWHMPAHAGTCWHVLAYVSLCGLIIAYDDISGVCKHMLEYADMCQQISQVSNLSKTDRFLGIFVKLVNFKVFIVKLIRCQDLLRKLRQGYCQGLAQRRQNFSTSFANSFQAIKMMSNFHQVPGSMPAYVVMCWHM